MKKKKIKLEKNFDDFYMSDENEEMEEYISEIEYKTETCKVIRIQDKGLIIDFKGHGLWIRTNGLIDKMLIPKDFIQVNYISDIGCIDFEIKLVFN